MAGGPSTPALAAAVNRGGGLGFLAAGYLTPSGWPTQIQPLRGLTDRPFGVNVFVGGGARGRPGRGRRLRRSAWPADAAAARA